MEWQLPRQWPGIMRGNLSPAELARYSRQIEITQWGMEAQERVKGARVFIAGAGGVAAALAIYLSTSGVGRIRIVDRTKISLANLNCQIIFRERDLGKSKAMVAQKRLAEVNPFVEVEALEKKITDQNVIKLTEGFDILVNAMNHFPSQELLNRAAVAHRLPLVHGELGELRGRIATFWPGKGPCLHCALATAPETTATGLLAPLKGIMGSLMSLEALRILGGLGSALLGRMLIFDGNICHFSEKTFTVNPDCPVCRGGKELVAPVKTGNGPAKGREVAGAG